MIKLPGHTEVMPFYLDDEVLVYGDYEVSLDDLDYYLDSIAGCEQVISYVINNKQEATLTVTQFDRLLSVGCKTCSRKEDCFRPKGKATYVLHLASLLNAEQGKLSLADLLEIAEEETI
jgi:hypothetical protein